MTNSFILDFDLLHEQNISVYEFIELIQISQESSWNSRENVVSLQSKQFIKIIDDAVIIREKGRLLLELVAIKEATPVKKVKPAVIDTPEFNSFIEEYRSLWRGLKVGSMGSFSSCRTKMQRWIHENPTYPKEDIMKAAKTYLDSVSNIYYLQQADNFIFKKEGKDEQSRLSAFIEEVNDRPVTDWTSELK
jgi:hypothetical protein